MDRLAAARRALPLLALVLAVFQAVRLLALVNRYSVDVPYWDQWTYYQAFMQPHSAWDLFRWQHGPHRQGIGFLLTGLVNSLTHWNQRAQCGAIAGVMLLCAAAALGLKRRLAGRLGWPDFALVMVVLTPQQIAMYAQVPNLSHGAVPLLLVLLSAWAWTARRAAVRYPALALLNVLCVFTGFALFAGALTPLLLAVDIVQALRGGRRGEAAAAAGTLAAALAGWALFFVDYRGVRVPPEFAVAPPWYTHVQFWALQYASFCGIGGKGWTAAAAGGAVALALCGLAARTAWAALREADPPRARRARAVAFLVGFTLLFSIVSSLGRVRLGLQGSAAGRYLPLLMPAAIGAYLWLDARGRPRLLAAFLLVVLFATVPWRARGDARNACRGKTAWVAAYRETGSLDDADLAARFPIFPLRNPAGRAQVPAQLAWLRERHYSLFRGEAPGGTAAAPTR